MSTGTVNIVGWLQQGFELYKNNFVLLFVSSIIVTLLSIVTFGILAGPLTVGLFSIVLRLIDRSEPPPRIEDSLRRFDAFLPSFLYLLVWGVLTMIAVMILAVIPIIGWICLPIFVVCVWTLLIFGLPLIADSKLDFWTATQTSAAAGKKIFLGLAGFCLVLFLTNIVVSYVLGSILGTFGSLIAGFITTPFLAASIGSAYRDQFPGGPPPAVNVSAAAT